MIALPYTPTAPRVACALLLALVLPPRGIRADVGAPPDDREAPAAAAQPNNLFDLVKRDADRAILDADREVEDAREAVQEVEAQLPMVAIEKSAAEATVQDLARRLDIPVPKLPSVAARLMDPGIVASADGRTRLLDEFIVNTGWTREDWGDGGAVSIDGERLVAQYEAGMKRKVAISRFLQGKLRLEADDVIVVEVEQVEGSIASMSLGLFVGHLYYESPMQRLRAGVNELRFPLAARSYKSQETGWQYRGDIKTPVSPDKLTFLIYAVQPGRIAFDNLRVVKTR